MSYIGQQLPADVFSGYVTDTFTGDGSATTFTLSKAPFSEDSLIVVVDNVIQQPTTNFTVSGTTLTIVGTAILSGIKGYAIHTGGVSPIGQATKVDANGTSDGVILDADGDTTIDAETDDLIRFKIGGTDLHSISSSLVDFNTQVAVSVTDNSDNIVLKSTDADANVGPNLLFERESSSPAANDFLGSIDFQGVNSNSDDHDYIRILSRILSTTDGSENGNLIIKGADGNNIAEFNSTEVVLNNDSQSPDFRVETNNNANTLIVKGANDRVGIGGGDANFGVLGIENAGDSTFDMFSNVGSGTRGKAEIFFSTDGSSDHHSCASIVMQQPTGDQASRKGEILLNVSDNGGPSTALTVANNGVVSGNLNDTSDENLKKNIEDLGASTDIIKALKPRKFDWKQTSAGSDIVGFVAQEVATVIPSAVVGNDYVADSLYEDGDTIPEGFAIGDIKSYGDKGKALNTTAILAHAVKTIQELETRIKTLEDA